MASSHVMTSLRKSTDRGDDPGEAPASISGIMAVVALALGLLLLAPDRRPHTAPTGPHECVNDPRDFLSAGELVDRSTLRFIIAAHCTRAEYRSDGWIELRYEGRPFGVETASFATAQDTYDKVVWIGGMLAP
jgi:hypothetical protein